jgi:hypothetical protein
MIRTLGAACIVIVLTLATLKLLGVFGFGVIWMGIIGMACLSMSDTEE